MRYFRVKNTAKMKEIVESGAISRLIQLECSRALASSMQASFAPNVLVKLPAAAKITQTIRPDEKYPFDLNDGRSNHHCSKRFVLKSSSI